MAKNPNLIPLSARTPEERRRVAQMGGLASGQAKKRRKALREYMEGMLLMVPGDKAVAWLEELGLKAEEINFAHALVGSLLQKAVDGDVSAFKEVRDLLGERGDTREEDLLKRADELLGGADDGL